jgi:hypothetical protein
MRTFIKLVGFQKAERDKCMQSMSPSQLSDRFPLFASLAIFQANNEFHPFKADDLCTYRRKMVFAVALRYPVAAYTHRTTRI